MKFVCTLYVFTTALLYCTLAGETEFIFIRFLGLIQVKHELTHRLWDDDVQCVLYVRVDTAAGVSLRLLYYQRDGCWPNVPNRVPEREVLFSQR